MKKAIFILASLLLAYSVFASDHADPMKIRKPLDGGLTDLFAFTRQQNLILILGIRPGLFQKPPFTLKPFTYRIFIDTHTPLTFASDEDNTRYGGTVGNPEGIRPDVSFTFALNDADASIAKKEIVGLPNPEAVQIYTGVRDDPFIFPKFFGKNVVAIVLSIPLAQFGDRQDFLFWATSSRGGKQIDHVGRSLRTMLPRLDFLNKLPPDKHHAALVKEKDHPSFGRRILIGSRIKAGPIFEIRRYDLPPDVMILTTRRPVSYPNGRQLTDDVAWLTCRTGDCLLFEVSFADSAAWPRITKNDKEFLDEFPYLAEPWEVP